MTSRHMWGIEKGVGVFSLAKIVIEKVETYQCILEKKGMREIIKIKRS